MDRAKEPFCWRGAVIIKWSRNHRVSSISLFFRQIRIEADSGKIYMIQLHTDSENPRTEYVQKKGNR
jgi:hypothetical protein